MSFPQVRERLGMKSFMALPHNNGATINSNAPLLFLPGRWKIGIPDISATLPFSVGLLFPNLDVFAVVIDRFAADIVYGQFIGAAQASQVTGLGYFHLARLPTDN